MNNKVLLGMSGGIDSSVAAISLLRQGFDVTGVTFLFAGTPDASQLSSGCANELALKLGIDHHTIDLRTQFNDLVIKYFIESYTNGTTPFPCAVCNPQLKFQRLLEVANELGCDWISTGHYARINEFGGNKYISRGLDPEKDQSFFLWGLDNKIIDRLILPLGSTFKAEVRRIAAENSFHFLTEKKESMGICFTRNIDYRRYLIEKGVEALPGHFIDADGNVLGMHKGIIHYTIGQRRGLNLQVNRPLFVIEIRHGSNEIVVGDYSELYRSRILLRDTKFLHLNRLNSNNTYNVKIRYRNQENRGRVLFHEEQKAVIELLEPAAMIAPGQTAVIYDDGRVLGGGFIERSE